MRVKHLWIYLPLPQNLKLAWKHVTFSRFTVSYFIIALVHSIVQVGLQFSAHTINRDAAHLMADIMERSNLTTTRLAFLSPGGSLRLCEGIPSQGSSVPCETAFDPSLPPPPAATPDPRSPSNLVTDPEDPEDEGPSSDDEGGLSSSEGVTSSEEEEEEEEEEEGASEGEEERRSIRLTIRSIFARRRGQHVTPTTSPAPPKRFFNRQRLAPLQPLSPELGATFHEKRGHVNVTRNGTLVAVAGLGIAPAGSVDVVFVNQQCAKVLAWPEQVLRESTRVDLSFVAYHCWLLGISIVAILNQSVPHIVAALASEVLATAWGAFQLAGTNSFRDEYQRVVTAGSCGGVDLLPDYFSRRRALEIPLIVLDASMLLVFGFLASKLVQIFGWQTFKRVGASKVMSRLYKLVLVLSIAIQLEAFFLLTSVALWVDQLFQGPFASFASHVTAYRAVSVIQLLLVIPWLVTGWIAVRCEQKKLMMAFLVITVIYIICWAAMFASAIYRALFDTWSFFAVVTVASAVLMSSTLILGVLCRLNFNLGLARYLKGQEVLDEADAAARWDYVPADPHRVQFPGTDPEGGNLNVLPEPPMTAHVAPVPTRRTSHGMWSAVTPSSHPSTSRRGTPPPSSPPPAPPAYAPSSTYDSSGIREKGSRLVAVNRAPSIAEPAPTATRTPERQSMGTEAVTIAPTARPRFSTPPTTRVQLRVATNQVARYAGLVPSQHGPSSQPAGRITSTWSADSD